MVSIAALCTPVNDRKTLDDIVGGCLTPDFTDFTPGNSSIRVPVKPKSCVSYDVCVVRPVTRFKDLQHVLGCRLVDLLKPKSHSGPSNWKFLLAHPFAYVILKVEASDASDILYTEKSKKIADGTITRVSFGKRTLFVCYCNDRDYSNSSEVRQYYFAAVENRKSRLTCDNTYIVSEDSKMLIDADFSDIASARKDFGTKPLQLWIRGKVNDITADQAHEFWREMEMCDYLIEQIPSEEPPFKKVHGANLRNRMRDLKINLSKSADYRPNYLNDVIGLRDEVYSTSLSNQSIPFLHEYFKLLELVILYRKSFYHLNGASYRYYSPDFLLPEMLVYVGNPQYQTFVGYTEIFRKANVSVMVSFNPSMPERGFVMNSSLQYPSLIGIAHFKTMSLTSSRPSKKIYASNSPCSCSRCHFWICGNCRKLFYYHQFDSKMVSCNCGNYSIFDIAYSTDCCQDKNITLPRIENIAENNGDLNILFVGPSGAGKSTLINGIANYLYYENLESAFQNELKYVMPCEFEIQDDNYDEHTVRIGKSDPENENFNNLGHSCTQQPKSYLFLVDNRVVNIIDTPGLADSRGAEQDDQNLQMIRDAILSAGSLHAICFVLKPNETKLTTSLEVTIRRLLTLFPRDALKNVVFYFTNSRATFYRPGDTINPLRRLFGKLLEERNIEIPFGKENVFCVDNEGFRYLCAQKCGINYFDGTLDEYNNSWIESREATANFFKMLLESQPFSTGQIRYYDRLEKLLRFWKPLVDSKDVSTFGELTKFVCSMKTEADADDLLATAIECGYEEGKCGQRVWSSAEVKEKLYKVFLNRPLGCPVADAIQGFLMSTL